VIEAVSRLSAPVAILFVGDGPLRSHLEAEARRRALTYARFVGFQNQTALARYYAAADVFVFPSAYEPYGLAVNEAMCIGLPILTTPAVAAASDLVREGENGFLFEVGDVKKLAARLNQVITDPELCQTMGRRSREMIRNWNYEACVEGVLQALDQAAGQRGDGGREDRAPW
jgi:glycosyltransferase involved in cell wall biosynthesis